MTKTDIIFSEEFWTIFLASIDATDIAWVATEPTAACPNFLRSGAAMDWINLARENATATIELGQSGAFGLRYDDAGHPRATRYILVAMPCKNIWQLLRSVISIMWWRVVHRRRSPFTVSIASSDGHIMVDLSAQFSTTVMHPPPLRRIKDMVKSVLRFAHLVRGGAIKIIEVRNG